MGFWPFVWTMYGVYLIPVAVLIYFIFSDPYTRKHNKGGCIFASGVMSVLASIFITIFSVAVIDIYTLYKAEPEKVGETVTIELQSLGDTDTTTGQFFLGTGTIDGERSINYTTKEANGRVHLENVKLDHSEVYEIEGVKPIVEVTPWAEVQHFPWGDSENAVEWTTYKFTIPPGSTTNDFVIDNE